MKKSFYVNVSGGLGLNIAFASFITAVKEQYPDKYEFYVCSPYWDVFECCDAVDSVYKPQELKDLIFDAKANNGELILHRLYDMDGFVKKQLNYSEAWAKLMNIPWKDDKKGTKAVSKLNTTKYNTKPQADNVMKQIKDAGFEDFVIMQFSGGQSPLVNVPVETRKDKNGKDVQVQAWDKVPYNYQDEPLKRHYPIESAKEFVEKFQKAHPKTAVVLYQLPNEPYDFVNTFRFILPYVAYYDMVKLPECVGTVSIDSSLQHLVAGVTRSVVIWAHSKPENFGYSYNKNIEQKCRTDDLLYFSALGPSGAKVSYISPDDLLKEVDGYLFGTKTEENK